MFRVNMLPMLGNDNRNLIAISTPMSDSNWYSRIIQLFNAQNSPFNVIQDILACNNCRVAGTEAQCTHMAHAFPSHKNQIVTDIQRALMPEKMFQAEIQGIIVPSGDRVFRPLDVQRIDKQERYDFKKPVDVIWVAIDPSAGSLTGSRCSMVAVALNGERDFVVSH